VGLVKHSSFGVLVHKSTIENSGLGW